MFKLMGIYGTVDPRRDLCKRQTTCRIRLAATLDDRASNLEVRQLLGNPEPCAEAPLSVAGVSI